ncbi:MAG: trypsin-like peptidase domain-containing protein [Pyrinomonadaceae bacterium]
MASGIIIHIMVGAEKRTEFFTEELIRIGSGPDADLQIHGSGLSSGSIWLELQNAERVYRIVNFDESLDLKVNESPVGRYLAISDGDIVTIGGSNISFSFFSLTSRSSLITTSRDHRLVAPFIEEAALESATTPQRDDAKAFLREFTRELAREVSWSTKLIVLVLALGFLSGILYLGYAVSNGLRENREQSVKQNDIIQRLEEQLGQTNDQLGQLDKTNKDIIKTVSLAPNLRVEYGSGVCLIVGVYDLVDKRSGKVLRYSTQLAYQGNPYEPAIPNDSAVPPVAAPQSLLTTEGDGSPVEYDFIGTGFHVGSGYIVTNRHVLRPWEEDDLVKQMMRDSNGRARVKRLVLYFPNMPQPFPVKVKQIGGREDLAVGTIDSASLSPEIPVLPLDAETDASAIGKTVVTMGYPNGPDRLLAMVDDEEAKSINSRFGNSRQNLINFLAQSRKIVPLTTQGLITDLDSRRIVHDAKTAEGGSGAPLFGQTGKVIGVNFGVFTENTAANMAVPIRFAIELLRKAGWRTGEEQQADAAHENQLAGADPNANAAAQSKLQ